MPIRAGRDHIHHKLLDIKLSNEAIYYFDFLCFHYAALDIFFDHSFPEKAITISFYAFIISSGYVIIF